MTVEQKEKKNQNGSRKQKGKPEEGNIMAGLTENLANHVCDKLCRFPYEITDETEMQNMCGQCEINRFLDQMQEAYDEINDFNNTQLSKLMKEHRKIVLCKNCDFRKDDNDCQGGEFAWCRLSTGLDGNLAEDEGCSRGRDIRRILGEEDDSERDD